MVDKVRIWGLLVSLGIIYTMIASVIFSICRTRERGFLRLEERKMEEIEITW